MNHSRTTNETTTIMEKTFVPGEAEPCLVRTDKTESIRIVNIDGTERKPSEEYIPKMTFVEKVKFQIRSNLLLFLTICAIFAGVALGFLGRLYRPGETALILLSFPGEMLLRVLKMLILPLIISSLITGLAQLDPKSSGKMGSRALFFYVFTTFVATLTGITMALLIRPGRKKIERESKLRIDRQSISTLDALLDIIRNMFPENIVQACSQTVTTQYKKTTKQVAAAAVNATATLAANSTDNATTVQTVERIVRELKYLDGTNVMGLVVFCIIFGIFISHSKSEAQILYDFFYVMNELIMKIIGVIMWYSPFGILCLVSTNIIKIDNMAETASRLSIYMLTVILGLAIHSMITIQLLYFTITRKNPFKFLKGMLQAWLTAIGTASSSATLPITFRCLEENNKVDKRVTRFMLPLGATINMDGTALYQCVATIFIAQLNGFPLSVGHLVSISLASTATSIGVASVPSASLVTMLIILGSLGLPIEDMSYIITVDWLLDRLRTSINVLGDAYGCGIVEHLSRTELKKLDDEAEAEFAQIISKTHENSPEPPSGSGGGGGESQPFLASREPSNVMIYDEKQHNSSSSHRHSGQQFDEFKSFEGGHQRRLSNRSQASIQQQAPLAVPDPTATSINQLQQQATPSIVVMDALRRRSRQLLFTGSKLPASVNSMPQISMYQQHQAQQQQQQQTQASQQPPPKQQSQSLKQQQQPSTSNLNATNQDSNV